MDFPSKRITFLLGGDIFMLGKYTTFAETEALLQIDIGLPGRKIKEIGADLGIKANTLYKWKKMAVCICHRKKQTPFCSTSCRMSLNAWNWQR